MIGIYKSDEYDWNLWQIYRRVVKSLTKLETICFWGQKTLEKYNVNIYIYIYIYIMKRYSTFPKAPGVEPQHQMGLCHIQDTRWGRSLIPLQKYRPSQHTGWYIYINLNRIFINITDFTHVLIYFGSSYLHLLLLLCLNHCRNNL